jgi:hypothetical protein
LCSGTTHNSCALRLRPGLQRSKSHPDDTASSDLTWPGGRVAALIDAQGSHDISAPIPWLQRRPVRAGMRPRAVHCKRVRGPRHARPQRRDQA